MMLLSIARRASLVIINQYIVGAFKSLWTGSFLRIFVVSASCKGRILDVKVSTFGALNFN